MSTKKRTYFLPAETVDRFEKSVPNRQRSRLLTRLIDDWLEAQRIARLREEVIEGCREMAEVYLETEREFHPLEEEKHRSLDP